MHSFVSHGLQFNYNSDFSGPVRITHGHTHEEEETTFSDIVVRAFNDQIEPNHRSACKELVSLALVNEGISRLEDMDTEDVLGNRWLLNILVEMMGEGI